MSARLFSYTSAALLIAISSSVPMAAQAANSRDFLLVNNADVDVVNLWSSAHNVKTWEEAFANVNVPATSQQEMSFAEPGDYVDGTCLMDIEGRVQRRQHRRVGQCRPLPDHEVHRVP